MSLLAAKKAIGRKAADLIQDGMIVGLGTGSTAECFIESLIEKRLSIQAVASSERSAHLAKKGGIPVIDINAAAHIDITVDGADEIDPLKRMIKGGGGALLREKILAAASGEMVVIVDESKLVPQVGRGKLPVEILHYGSSQTRRKIESLGYQGAWRTNRDGSFYLTENGNLIFDITFDSPPADPEQDDENLLRIPGVIETGFFFSMAGRILIGYTDGRVVMRD